MIFIGKYMTGYSGDWGTSNVYVNCYNSTNWITFLTSSSTEGNETNNWTVSIPSSCLYGDMLQIRNDMHYPAPFCMGNCGQDWYYEGMITWNTTGGWYIYDNADQTIDDSGDWNITATCSDAYNTSSSYSREWTVAWGYLEVGLDNPTSYTKVQQNKTFSMNGTVTCRNGECASEGEQIKLWADPDGELHAYVEKIVLPSLKNRLIDKIISILTGLKDER